MMPHIESKPTVEHRGRKRECRPKSAHRDFNYLSYSEDPAQLRQQADGWKDVHFGKGFYRRPRDTSVEAVKQAQYEAKLRDGALRESLRQQVIAQADRYNGYDVINGDISNEQRIKTAERRLQPQRRHFEDQFGPSATNPTTPDAKTYFLPNPRRHLAPLSGSLDSKTKLMTWPAQEPFLS